MISIRPESAHYFYGSITRENSELILWDRGCIDGMFLLRASQNKDAEFVLSLCYRNNVLHYPIKKSIDGKYFVCGLPTEKFMSPVELVQSVKQLACLPKIPCNRAIDVFMPDGTYGVSEQEIEKAIGERAAEWGIQASELEKLMKEKPEDFRDLIVKSLHTSRPWFHGNISREEAEARIVKSGHSDGKFLVRERDNSSFTLCLSFNQNIKHYKIDVLSSGEVGIQDGQRFGNLILLVHHYSFLSDGLWCALKEPCVRPGMSAAGSSVPPITNLPTPKVSNVEPRPHLRSEPTSPLSPTASSMPFTNNDSNLRTNVDTDASNAPKTSQDPDGNKPQPPPKPRGIANILKQSARATPVPVTQNQLKPPINLDQNHNNCTQSDEVSMGDGSSREDGSSQAGKPVPAPRKKPQQKKCSGKSDEIVRNNDADEEDLPAPGRIGKVLKSLSLENILQGMKPRPASWAPSLVSPTTPIEKLLPVHIPSNSTPTQVVTPIRKTSAPTPMSTNSMSVVISELKLQISGIGQQQQQLPRSPDPAVSPNSGTVHSPKSSCESLVSTPEEAGAEQTVKFPVIEEVQMESQETEFEPVYEEIDPDYDNNSSTDKRNRTNALSRTSSEIDGSTCDSVISDAVQENPWDDASEDGPNNGTLKLKRRPTMSVEESEHHYKAMKRCRKTPTTIDRSLIIPQEILGCGQFGDVMKATLKSGIAEIPVAVKMLRNSLPSAKREIMREASIMMELDHAHIVRLSGICEGEPFLLVMEMAPLGPLGLYLKKNETLPCRDLLILMHQVALGMEYLESKQFVHRDLAARNVLLVNENFAKISDFGMSRTLGLHSDYYRVEPQGKLPLKWYAPECIYYFRFSSKSDVWSYGVTLWEAFSYGERPYKGLVGREILTMFASGQRLPCPLGCSQVVYDIMWKCWQLQPEERPTFAQLVVDLRKMLN